MIYHRYKILLLPILCIGLAFLHGLILYSASSGMDDVYMTYWVAQKFSELGVFVNYNGDLIEQSSSLLHVIILAVLYKISSIPLSTLGICFSALMGGLTMLLAWHIARYLKVKSAWLVVLFCAVFPYLVHWSFTGLETTLAAFITLSLVYFVIKFFTEPFVFSNSLVTVLLIFFYVLVRPEAFFIILMFISGILLYFVSHNLIIKQQIYGMVYFVKATILIGVNLVFFGLVSLWRYIYFGYVFPQPVYAKSAGIHTERSIQGIEYLLDHFWIPSLVIITILAVFAVYNILLGKNDEKNKLTFIIITSFIVTIFAFTIASGGDWMMGGRFIIPILPLLVILGIYTTTRLTKPTRSIVLFFLIFTATFDAFNFFKSNYTVTPLPIVKKVYEQVLQDFAIQPQDVAWSERVTRGYLRDVPVIKMLDIVVKRLLTTKQNLTILSGEMGTIPFYIGDKYFKKVRFLDRYALATNDFSLCPVSGKMYRGKFGLQMSTWYFLKFKFDKINAECGIQRPDILYGLFGYNMMKWAEDFKNMTIFENFDNIGYKVVYFQYGDITTGLRQRSNKANYYIAVREDLLPLVGKLEPPYYKWPTIKRAGKWSW